MEYQSYSAQTARDLADLARRRGVEAISELTPRELSSSASRWTYRHLIAYRLLAQPEQSSLPVLASTHDQCPQCHGESSAQRIDRYWTEKFTGEAPQRLSTLTESELAAMPGGFFWVALARALRRELAVEERVHPERDRQSVDRSEYVSSVHHIVGSSSPLGPSSSEYEASTSDIDEEEHYQRQEQPEEVTLFLSIAFLQYTLNLCLSQDPGAATELRARVERRTNTTEVVGAVRLIAQDDGGICNMRRHGDGWFMDRPWLAILEAKRAFGYIGFNSASGEYAPVVTNENLAQYLGEAVIVWKANRDRLQDDVFLIAAVNTFISFLHFRFNSDYMEYLDAVDAQSQRAIIRNIDKNPVVQMHRTKWYNLEKRQARHDALCHILALVRFYDAQERLRFEVDGSDPSGSAEDSDSDMDTDE